MRLVVVILCLLTAIACDQEMPTAPAVPIGEFPKWGQDFAMKPGMAPGSALFDPSAAAVDAGPPPPGAPAPAVPAAPAPAPGAPGAAPSGIPAPPAAGPAPTGAAASGAEAAAGRPLFGALCAQCHGATGEGGAMPGVPSLADPAFHARANDAAIADVIAKGRGAMPGFAAGLDEKKLASLVAYVRTLKR